jgi:hypothetical protein
MADQDRPTSAEEPGTDKPGAEIGMGEPNTFEPEEDPDAAAESQTAGEDSSSEGGSG